MSSDRIPPGEHPGGRSTASPGPSGPREDVVARESGENRANGPNRVHSRYSTTEAVVDLLTAYKWPLLLGGVVVTLVVGSLAATGNLPTVRIPPWMWHHLGWATFAAAVASVPAYLLLKRFRTVEGVEVWDVDPVTGSHRHLRLGGKLYDDLVVKSPWGSVISKEELTDCTVNGRKGVEMMDFRVLEDGTPVCVAPWVGEASGAQMRTYRRAFNYARQRLARRAEKASLYRANIGELARESAERMVAKHVVRSESTGIPHGDQIDSVIEEVMRDAGLNDPLDLDLGDRPDDLGRDLAHEPEDRESADPRTNGHDDGARDAGDVEGVAAADGGTDR